MIGSLIRKNFYKFINQHYVLNIPQFDEQVDDDLLTNDDIIDALCVQPAITAKPKIQELLALFKEASFDQDFLINNYAPQSNVELLDFSSIGFKKRNRAFSYSDAQFGYLSLKKLFQYSPLSTIGTTSPAYKTLLDFIATAIINVDNDKIIDLLRYIQTSNHSYGILIHKFAHAHQSLSIYSYLYYKELLNGGKIELDPKLNYSLPHNDTAVYSGGIIYEQYFEVFDIINELNHSSDVINRFLHLYHILEYLSYRVELVTIERKARLNKTFIREIHSLTGRGQSDKEWDVFNRNFKKLFERDITDGRFNLRALTRGERVFLQRYWEIGGFTNTNYSHWAKLIYKIRNSIVHNKESEFHITITNTDEYEVVINLVKEIISIVEENAFSKLSTNAKVIRYGEPHIELY